MTTDAPTIASASSEAFEHPDPVANQAFGFWLYLMSDLILFSALFAVFAVLGRNYANGPTGKDIFALSNVFVETIILLTSSATCGLAMLAMHGNRRNQALFWLFTTFLLGLGFLYMEIQEFHHLIIAGHGPQESAFLSAFFTLVGTHGAHVAFGLIWILVLMGQMLTKGLGTPVQSRLMRLSMFWHFLDIVWVGVFTVVYLMGVL